MVSWPDLGTRVTVRYRRPAGSVPPLTDAVGHLLAIDPVVRVRTKTGAVVEFAAADVVALRVLTDAPVRTAAIRALEHAAAAGWPGLEKTEEQTWLDGWLLRAGHGVMFAANSAVPLEISANASAIPAIVAWYTSRGLTPRLAIPDRLLRVPPGLTSEYTERVLVRDVGDEPDGSRAGVTLGATADRELAHAAVTDAPDGTRWVGLSEVRAADDLRGAIRVCEELLAWGALHGATRGYLRVGERDTNATTLAESLGFRLHHRSRYFSVRSGTWDTV
jgi:N-acetylglutamate synthase